MKINTYYEIYLKEKGLNKNIILFDFRNNLEQDSYAFKVLKTLKICNIFSISNYDLFIDIMSSKEINGINTNKFLFYIFGDNLSNKNLMKAIKTLMDRKVEFRLFSHQDYRMIYNSFISKYLLHKGIDVSSPIIDINNFLFENFLAEDFSGVFECGDLILPTLFNDYTMVREGPYEYGEVVINKDDIVFDCGANVGSFSAYALNKGSEVHAFEPIYETFLLLDKHLKHFKNSKKFLNNIGLSYRTGLIDFYIKDVVGSTNSYIKKEDYRGKLQCHITTIDEYVKKNNISKVDFIKADIEGAERDMLVGAIKTIKKHKPKISVCTYHFEDDSPIIEGIIREACNEYKVIHKWKKCYAWV